MFPAVGTRKFCKSARQNPVVSPSGLQSCKLEDLANDGAALDSHSHVQDKDGGTDACDLHRLA